MLSFPISFVLAITSAVATTSVQLFVAGIMYLLQAMLLVLYRPFKGTMDNLISTVTAIACVIQTDIYLGVVSLSRDYVNSANSLGYLIAQAVAIATVITVYCYREKDVFRRCLSICVLRKKEAPQFTELPLGQKQAADGPKQLDGAPAQPAEAQKHDDQHTTGLPPEADEDEVLGDDAEVFDFNKDIVSTILVQGGCGDKDSAAAPGGGGDSKAGGAQLPQVEPSSSSPTQKKPQLLGVIEQLLTANSTTSSSSGTTNDSNRTRATVAVSSVDTANVHRVDDANQDSLRSVGGVEVDVKSSSLETEKGATQGRVGAGKECTGSTSSSDEQRTPQQQQGSADSSTRKGDSAATADGKSNQAQGGQSPRIERLNNMKTENLSSSRASISLIAASTESPTPSTPTITNSGFQSGPVKISFRDSTSVVIGVMHDDDSSVGGTKAGGGGDLGGGTKRPCPSPLPGQISDAVMSSSNSNYSRGGKAKNGDTAADEHVEDEKVSDWLSSPVWTHLATPEGPLCRSTTTLLLLLLLY